MLPSLQPDRIEGIAAVEGDEERVGAGAVLGRPGHAQGVQPNLAGVASDPSEGRGWHLVARALTLFLNHDLYQASRAKGLQQVLDDSLALGTLQFAAGPVGEGAGPTEGLAKLPGGDRNTFLRASFAWRGRGNMAAARSRRSFSSMATTC